jgi:16S rRNA (uracil1498-N3)-methyltransferase
LSRSHRLFVPPADIAAATSQSGEHRLVVAGEGHRHLARVLRVGRGESVTLFDGTGSEVEAEVVRVGARETELQVTAGARRAGVSTAPAVAITLLTAIPRGERMDLLIEKACELGVARVVPVVAERSVVRPGAGTPRRRRWEKIAREAARQCGRADVPAIADPTPLPDVLAGELPPRRFALAPDGTPLRAALDGPPAPTALLVGPEGGLAPDEIAAAEAAGFAAVSVGPRILRVETAAIAAVTLVHAAAGGLG